VSHKSLEELLLELGSTADNIAANLIEMGIEGIPKSYHGCPVLNYLRENHGLDKLRISGGGAGPYYIYDYTNEIDEPVRPWKPLQKFLEKFDNGEYPELIL
jgi:hypothetical protein